MPAAPPPPARRTVAGARRAALWAFVASFLLNSVGLTLGLREDGWGWAFQVRWIAFVSLGSLTAGVGGLILSIIVLLHQRGRDVPAWVILAGLLIAGLGALALLVLSLAASKSI